MEAFEQIEQYLESPEGKLSIGDSAIAIASMTEKRTVIEGVENIKHHGRFIVVLNHFVTDKNLPMEEKWIESLEAIGFATKELRKLLNPDKKIVWLVALKPKSAIENGEELASDEKRKQLLLGMEDVIPVSYSPSGAKEIIESTANNISEGNVIGIFPEGKTGHELQEASDGFADLAIRNNVPVYPIAVYADKETFTMKFGEAQYPPTELSSKQDFKDSVMGSIALMLPESLRGYYKTDQ